MTDTLARIKTVLAGWEAQPLADGDWLPGDPLYDRPRGSAWGEQTIRPMFSVLEDGVEWASWSVRCEPCQVSWAGISACWVCGEERPPRGLKSSADYAFMVGQVFGHSAVAAAAAFEEQMVLVREAFGPVVGENIRRAIESVRPR